MSFDKEDGVPLVNAQKKTTKVNIWMVVAIVAFAGFGIFTYLTL